ncbi:sulfotransferase family protein [Pleomorphovibrio marinus]|uniref:sulfotransferase family protein n=1 Tax=Pleomorphovibrio marinus TaxID=2164132 RepID=UPI000E0A19A0|nr:sulfotransferase [Pleomorphovibrio marinus]
MKKPNFIIIGAHKAGTTALYNFLSQHPEIFMSKVKEPKYFAFKDEKKTFTGFNDPANIREYCNEKKYFELFSDVKNEKLIGEASTIYLYDERSVYNIKNRLGNIKIIACLRNPIDRAYSNYLYARRDGREDISNFRKALDIEDERIKSGWGPLWHYKKKGIYSKSIKKYLEVFGKDNVKIVFYDDLINNATETLHDVFKFLNVNDFVTIDITKKYNVSGIPKNKVINNLLEGKFRFKKIIKRCFPNSFLINLKNSISQHNLKKAKPISFEDRSYLIKYYKNDIKELMKITNKNLNHWLK